MEQQYKGPVTDRRIRELFADAGDFNYRTVEICGFPVHTYAIDGLTSGGDISDFVIRPLLENLQGNSMQELYQRALQTVVYNSVADVCPDLDTAARKLVNGFCVVLFEGTGAIAFEDKTEEKRSPSRPEVENTVKGPKDAFTETIRTNTSLIRRHLRTPELQLYETVVGRRSLTNVAIVSIRGLTSKELVRRLKQRLAEIDIDGLLTPAAVEEYLTGSRPTAFPLLQYTERTDRFAQALLEGKPVYYCPEGLDYRRHAKTANRALWSALLAAERRLRVNCDFPDDLAVVGNREMLTSIFRNLASNAVAYSSGRDIFIRLVAEDDEKYTISFADNGIGVEEEHLPRLFERFYRVDKGRSRKMGGTGLGLSIVKNAVAMHGGTIEAHNRLSGGLEFIFTLKKNS